jgi:hypothetical protein
MGSRGVDAPGLADRLREQEEHLPICRWCGCGQLYVLEECPDPNFGALGVVQRTLKCDWAGCGKLTTD